MPSQDFEADGQFLKSKWRDPGSIMDLLLRKLRALISKHHRCSSIACASTSFINNLYVPVSVRYTI